MTHLFHLYRHSQNNFFFENRFVYAGEATPSPDIADGEILAAGIEGSVKGGIDLKTHHFDDAKIKALNLLADVDKIVLDKDLRPQADKLKAELANHATEGIHAKFDALHAEYDTRLNDTVNGIAKFGPTHPEAEKIRVGFRARAEALIVEVKARVAEPEVKDYVTHHAGMEALGKASTPEQRIAERTKVLESMFTALQIPQNVRGIARAMAEVMEDLNITIASGGSVEQVREWFKAQLENTNLIQRSMEQLASAMPRFEATPSEITMFTDLLNKKPDGTATNVNSERLGFTFGLPNMPQAAEALGRRFHTVTTQGAEGPQTYYVDLKDPNKTVYTAGTLQKALPGIVEKEMHTGEAVGAQLAAMREQDSQLQIALAEVADVNQHWYNPASWNDMIDTRGELSGEDAEKLEHLATLLNLTNPAQDSVATFDKTERGRLDVAAKAKAEAARLAAEQEHQVNEYAKARTGLVALSLAEGAQFVPKTPDLAKAKPGATDEIEIKNKAGDKVLAKVEAPIDAQSKPTLIVFKEDGTTEAFKKTFDSMQALWDFLNATPPVDVAKIPEKLVAANQAKVEAVRAALWPLGKPAKKGTKGPEQLALGKSGLSMEASAAVLGRVGLNEPLVVTIALFDKAKREVGHIQVDFPVSGNPKAQIVMLGKAEAVASNLQVADIRKNLENNGKKYLDDAKEEAELAKTNEADVGKVFAAITLPPGPPAWTWGDKNSPNYAKSDAVATKEVKMGLGQKVVATIEVQVGPPHALTLKPAGGTLGNKELKPDAVQQFLTANAINLPPAPEATVAAVPGATPEGPTVRSDLLPARENLVKVLQARYPQLFDGDAINKPETKAAIDGILTRLGNNRERIALLTEGRFIPTDSETRIVMEEFEKANRFGETDRAVDPKEIGFINGLQTSGGATFESVFGKDSTLAKALSKQYAIKPGEKSGIIINDGQKDHVVLKLNQLASHLPQADRKAFETAIDPAITDPTAKRAALDALATSAGDREKAMDDVRAVREALRGEKAKEVFGKMGIGELIASITQIWKAIQEGMKTGDFTVANDVLKLLNAKRNPAEIMNKNQKNFANILRDAQPKDIGQLLGAYLSPKGAEAGEVFGEANAKTAGLDETAIKDLAFFRTEMKPAIEKYLTSKLGLPKIESIAGADGGNAVVTGFRGGQKYEIEFSTNASGQFCAQIFKFHDKPAEGDTKAIKQGERDETAVGATTTSDGAIVSVDFEKIHEVITGKKPADTRVAAAPAAPPPEAPPTAKDLGWGKNPPKVDAARAAILAMPNGKALLAQYAKEAGEQKPKNPDQWRLDWLIKNKVPKAVPDAVAKAVPKQDKLGWGREKGIDNKVAREAVKAKGGDALLATYTQAAGEADNPNPAWRLDWLIKHDVPKPKTA